MTTPKTVTRWAQLVEKAHTEGAKAYRDGHTLNPYAGTELHQAWNGGWEEAQEWARTGDRIPGEDGVYPDISDHVYHSDRDSLSSTGAKTILEPGGPALWRWAPRKESAAFDFGHAAHELVLGKGAGIAVVDADSWRTKDAKAAQDQARADGKTPMLRKEFQRAERLADAVLTHPVGALIFADGQAETSIWATDPDTGARIRCRPDWWEGATFYDLKTTTRVGDFDKTITKWSYHLSAAFYLHTAKCVGLEVDSFVFVAVDKDEPHLVDVVELDADSLTIGADLTRAAIDLWARCHRADMWPGLPEEPRITRLPDWVRVAADNTIARAASVEIPTTRKSA
ncbi:MAG: PD-(D/E)XK nuclease-like domain-containing protein [Gordonia sp. (in: high G+C Gram-positive bacteria)]